MNNDIIESMARDLVIANVDINALTYEDGSPTGEFVDAANREAEHRGAEPFDTIGGAARQILAAYRTMMEAQ